MVYKDWTFSLVLSTNLTGGYILLPRFRVTNHFCPSYGVCVIKRLFKSHSQENSSLVSSWCDHWSHLAGDHSGDHSGDQSLQGYYYQKQPMSIWLWLPKTESSLHPLWCVFTQNWHHSFYLEPWHWPTTIIVHNVMISLIEKCVSLMTMTFNSSCTLWADHITKLIQFHWHVNYHRWHKPVMWRITPAISHKSSY